MIAAPAIQAQEWELLFDGKSLAGWTTSAGKAIESGWEIKDGALHRHGKGGDIVSAREFLDFELEFEWRVAPEANSGLKYRVADYSPVGKNIGVEYQLLDDSSHADGKSGMTATASIYALVPSSPAKKLQPVGEWNRGKVVAVGERLEHWLNGEKVAAITMGNAEWKEALANSKFRAAPDFGVKKGRILLQDHGGEVWFRNLRILKMAR